MFDFSALYEAESVEDAIRLLKEHPKAKILAGGSDMLIKIREGRLAGCELVSLFGIDALRGVSEEPDGALRILPLTSFSHIERSGLIAKRIPALCEAAGQVGGPQIRAIGTIGGNVCNGVTSADTASTLLAYDAVLELTGENGVRRVPAGEFYLGAGKTDVRPSELLTAITLPDASLSGYYGHYIKYAMRNAMDIATVSCSVNVKLSPDGKSVEGARCAFGVMGPVPARAPEAEAWARGKSVSEKTAREFGKAAAAGLKPRTSWRAPAEFRSHIAAELAERAFTEAARRAGGDI